MLPLSNGSSEFHQQSHVIAVTHASHVGEARRFASTLGNAFELAETPKGRAAIIVNELANNLVRYAKDGSLMFSRVEIDGQAGLQILAIDRGPGLDASLVMEDGFTTGETPGTGLGAVRRQSDVFDLHSTAERGTVMVSQIYNEKPPRPPKDVFEYGAINLAVQGETLCGDAWSVYQRGSDLEVLMADGLGHGPAAHAAAREAVTIFEARAPLSPEQMTQLIHSGLKSTRGAAVFVLSARTQSLSFCGVGNIRAFVQGFGHPKGLISQNGTAGLQVRTVRLENEPWNGLGYIILHSDGLTSRWDLSGYTGLQGKHSAVIAGVAFRDFLRGKDDATILVLRRRP